MDDDVAGGVDEFDGKDASPAFFKGCWVSLAVDSPFFSEVEAGLGLLYKSAYHPPPLRIKFPPLTCRFAELALHRGQACKGASVIFWISSQAYWHWLQVYS
ncbi:hypothetical protein BCY86_05050 [Pajaroellobacter abortibovis]|uniref:Uncharacterized protein n=1 Tax=Pajaroellobacter abortibovis TaxID=1882918 RepID=A0A1L6MXJ4_9BACT|nr:hypothetical protein BCY86_05050 [Pajaroellobacter abortibovis]